MKKVIISLLVIFIIPVSLFSQADDTDNSSDFSKWQIRLRGILVTPSESAAIGVIGGDVAISSTFVPELDFTYFFTENWSAELILATTKHDVNTTASNLTPVGLPASVDVDLGNVWLLPPTLTAQYHFATEGFRPYLGAGINYTFFYNVDAGNTIKDVDYDNSFGFAFQGGFDYDLDDKWFLNLDAKYILLSTDVTVDASNLIDEGSLNIPAEVDINPFIVGIGVGMRF
jgi:outer membrane protein